MKRHLEVPTDDQRCQWDINRNLGHSRYQCSRRKVIGDLCTQHAKMADAWHCEYCGGNDELPPDHTMDCDRPNREE